jgi:regulator of sigma E protease
MQAVTGAGLELWNSVTFILPFFAVLTTVVFVHEFGHFWVGRLCGAQVEAFSIGMGPELAGFTDRMGTRWRLSIIPIGGYVRFAGDRGAASAPDSDGLARMSAAERRKTRRPPGPG